MLRKIVGIALFLSTSSLFALDAVDLKTKLEETLGNYQLDSGTERCTSTLKIEFTNISYKTQNHLFNGWVHPSEKRRHFKELSLVGVSEAGDRLFEITDINEGNIYFRNENPMCMSPFPCYDKWQMVRSKLDGNKITSTKGYVYSSLLYLAPIPKYYKRYVMQSIEFDDGFNNLEFTLSEIENYSTEERLLVKCLYRRG